MQLRSRVCSIRPVSVRALVRIYSALTIQSCSRSTALTPPMIRRVEALRQRMSRISGPLVHRAMLAVHRGRKANHGAFWYALGRLMRSSFLERSQSPVAMATTARPDLYETSGMRSGSMLSRSHEPRVAAAIRFLDLGKGEVTKCPIPWPAGRCSCAD